jgi:IS30 family transposase
MSLGEIAKEVGCTHWGIDVLRSGQSRAARPDTWTPRRGCLSASDREQVLFGLRRGESMNAIAGAHGRSLSPVTSEVKANGGPDRYRVWSAHASMRVLPATKVRGTRTGSTV